MKEKINIQEELSEFIMLKTKSYNGDIRREIEECFTCWLEEKWKVKFSAYKHEKITRDALEMY